MRGNEGPFWAEGIVGSGALKEVEFFAEMSAPATTVTVSDAHGHVDTLARNPQMGSVLSARSSQFRFRRRYRIPRILRSRCRSTTTGWTTCGLRSQGGQITSPTTAALMHHANSRNGGDGGNRRLRFRAFYSLQNALNVSCSDATLENPRAEAAALMPPNWAASPEILWP